MKNSTLQDLIESFMLYPGIGPKNAERLAYYTILDLDDKQVEKIANNLINAKKSIKKCVVCGNISDSDVCEICSSVDRENEIMVVESTKEIMAFENTKAYHGKYHVLNGLISPMNGKGPSDINVSSLFERIKKENINKVIIATSASLAGEMTALYIKNVLAEMNCEAYRIGYGLPVGGDIEYADQITLAKSLEGIKKY